MALDVSMGATLQCTFGVAPSSLIVLPTSKILSQSKPAATIMDHKPFVNILPFGVCSSLANPTVAAATSAALGVLTPMPCIPATSSPWVPGAPTVLMSNKPALNNSSKCMCNWGGVISVINPSVTTITVP